MFPIGHIICNTRALVTQYSSLSAYDVALSVRESVCRSVYMSASMPSIFVGAYS